MALVERHAAAPRRASAGDWTFVIAMTLLLVAIAAVPFVIVGWLLSALERRLF